MFKRKDIKKLSIMFGCEEKDIEPAIHSMTKYLKSAGINTYTVARATSIISDKLFKLIEEEDPMKLPDFGMRSDVIKKYKANIVQLYYDNYDDDSFGYGSISKQLKDEFKVSVSRQTVKAYILNYMSWKINNG